MKKKNYPNNPKAALRAAKRSLHTLDDDTAAALSSLDVDETVKGIDTQRHATGGPPRFAQVGLAEGDDVRFVAERRTQVTIQFRSKPRISSSARSSRPRSQRRVTPEECAQSQPASCRHGTKP
jgi:hypothetical protein